MLIPAPDLPETEPVAVDGTLVATRVLDPVGPSRGDVVLCHGTPWTSQIWRRVADDLGRDFRVFLWDMPGYGESARGPAVSVTLRDQARRLAVLIAHWGLQDPHVVAHDVGAAVALGAHLRHGVDYADLFLWDAVTLDPWGSPFFALVAEHADVFDRLPAELHSALVREYIAGAVRHRLTAPEVALLAAPWRGPLGQAAFSRQIAALDAADTRPIVALLNRTRCPIRLGWGSDDPWIPLHQAYELQARLPGAPRVVELDDVGHLAPVEDPAAVISALREWLADSANAASGA